MSFAYNVRQVLEYAFGPSPDCDRLLERPPAADAASLPDEAIPVWSYWSGADSPTVERCLQSWRRHLPSPQYDIRVLGPETVARYVDVTHACFRSPNAALRSDYIRLALLDEYGGVWMDASVLLTRGLHEWDFLGTGDGRRCFNAFYNPGNMTTTCDYPVVETSVMAAPKGHALVRDWRDRLRQLGGECAETDIDAYMDRADARALQRKNLLRRYHVVYHMLQHALWYFGGLSAYAGVRLFKSWDYHFLTARADAPLDAHTPPLLKLVSSDRKRLDEALRAGRVPADAVVLAAA